jgi:hypothetical protein
VIDDISAVTDAAQAQATYALKLYKKYERAVKKLQNGTKIAAALQKIASNIADARSQVISAGLSLPLVHLSCNGKATCTTTSYAVQVASTESGFAAIRKQTLILAKKANRFLKNVPVFLIKKKADNLFNRSQTLSSKLPITSDICTE